MWQHVITCCASPKIFVQSCFCQQTYFDQEIYISFALSLELEHQKSQSSLSFAILRHHGHCLQAPASAITINYSHYPSPSLSTILTIPHHHCPSLPLSVIKTVLHQNCPSSPLSIIITFHHHHDPSSSLSISIFIHRYHYLDSSLSTNITVYYHHHLLSSLSIISIIDHH